MLRESYREEPGSFDAEPSTAAAARIDDADDRREGIDEGREGLEARLDSSRSGFAAAEYTYKQALKEVGVSRKARRELSEEAEAVATRECPDILNRYRHAKETYQETRAVYQRDRLERGSNKQETIAQALEFRLQERKQLQDAQYEARPKKERGLIWKTGAAVFRGFRALNEKINKLPPAARRAANVARWGAAGAVGGVGVVYGLPMIGLGLGAAGLGAGATIGMRAARSVFGGFTGMAAAGGVDVIAKNYMERRGLTKEQFQEQIEAISRGYEEREGIDALEKFLAEKGADLEERYARMERAQKVTGYTKIAAAIIGGGVGGYFGFKHSAKALGQLFAGPSVAEAQVSPGGRPAEPQGPLSREALERKILETRDNIEKGILKQLQDNPRARERFQQDLTEHPGAAWTKAGTQAEIERAWARWRADYAAQKLHAQDPATPEPPPSPPPPPAPRAAPSVSPERVKSQSAPRSPTSAPSPPGSPPPEPRAVPPQGSNAPPSSPKSSFDKLIVDRARVGESQGVENSFANQIKANPKVFGFQEDLKHYKGKSAWTKAATPEAMQEEWAKWKAHRLALETGVVQKGKELLALDQTQLGRKNAAYVLEMEGGKPKVTMVLEDNKGGYKADASFTPDHKWDGKPIKGYEYMSESGKASPPPEKIREPGAKPKRLVEEPPARNRKVPVPTPRPEAESPPPAAESWGPNEAPHPEGASATDPFGNPWRVVEHTAGTDKVLYEADITSLPDDLKRLLPKGVELVAGTDSPGGPYRYFGLYDVPEGEETGSLILRLRADEIARFSDHPSALRHAVEAARERFGFIKTFTERVGWDRATTVQMVKDLEMGRSFEFRMNFDRAGQIMFEIAPSKSGVIVQMPDHSSPFSGEHFHDAAGKRIEELININKSAQSLQAIRNQTRILYDTLQSYNFDRKFEDVMKLNFRNIEIQAQEWQSHGDTSARYAQNQGGFAGWLVEEAEKLKRQGMKITPQTKVGTILDAIARDRA